MANGTETAPAPPAKGAKAKRQKRLLYVAGAAVVLALIFLMQRGGGAPPAEEDPAAAAEPVPTGAPPFGSTFADNGEAAGNLGTAITEGLSGVQFALEDQGMAFDDLTDRLNDQPPVNVDSVAPGGVGTNTAAGKAKKQKSLPPRSTSDHAAAGLHRVGTSGNTYRDAKGKPFHRVGKGSEAHFEPGKPAAKKPAAKKPAKPKQQNNRPSTPPRAAPRPPSAPPGVHGKKGGTNAQPKKAPPKKKPGKR